MKKMWIIGVVILVLFVTSLPSMKPSGPAPDTTAPDTTAPIITGDDITTSSPDITTAETTVPDTTAQETTNPETTVPDTTESVTTPAPETTKAPETETPHSHSYKVVVIAPTCTEAGYTTYTCDCGDNYVADKVAATGHSYETVVTTAPTCTEAGEEKRTCSCGATETKAIPAKGHTEVKVPGRDATCTKTGLTDGKKCSACGVVIVPQENIPLKEHIVVKIPGKPATCTEKGLTDGKECSLCGTVTMKQKEIAAKGHTEVKVSGKAATCTEKGLTDGKKCSVCGTVTVKQTTIPAKGHTEVTVKGKAATCTEKGLTDGKKCSVCDTVTVKQTTIPAKGHTEKTLAAKAATCTETGLTEGKQCSVCKAVTVAQKSVAAKGHKWDSGTVSGNTKTYKCTVCKTTKTETISTCSHSFGPWQWEAYTFEHYTGDAWFDEFYGPSTETSHRKFRVCSKCGYRDVEEHGDHICAAYISATVLCDNCLEGKDTYFVCGICGWNWTTHEKSVHHEHIEEVETFIEASECTEKTRQIKTTCLDCGSVSYSYPVTGTFTHNYDPALGINQIAVSIPNAYDPNPDPKGVNWMIRYFNFKYDSNGYITSFDVHWHDKDQNCKVVTIVVAEVKQTFIDWGYTFPEGSRRGVEIALYDGYYVPMRQTGTS